MKSGSGQQTRQGLLTVSSSSEYKPVYFKKTLTLQIDISSDYIARNTSCWWSFSKNNLSKSDFPMCLWLIRIFYHYNSIIILSLQRIRWWRYVHVVCLVGNCLCILFRMETVTETGCCPGYQGQNCTEPICDPPCTNGGVCIEPSLCRCPDGYSGYRCEDLIGGKVILFMYYFYINWSSDVPTTCTIYSALISLILAKLTYFCYDSCYEWPAVLLPLC